MYKRQGKVRAIDDIVFHADYERDASLVKRVTPLPDDAHTASFVAALERNLPKNWGSEPSPRICGVEDEEPLVAIEELLPIRIHHIVEPEPERPGAVGVVTTHQGSKGALADPESSLSENRIMKKKLNQSHRIVMEVSSNSRNHRGRAPPCRYPSHSLNGWMTAMDRTQK